MTGTMTATSDGGRARFRSPLGDIWHNMACEVSGLAWQMGMNSVSHCACHAISPDQLKNLRGRYGSAGNKDVRLDAFVLADTLRTDRVRLRRLVSDSESTVALRSLCRACRDFVAHRVWVAN